MEIFYRVLTGIEWLMMGGAAVLIYYLPACPLEKILKGFIAIMLLQKALWFLKRLADRFDWLQRPLPFLTLSCVIVTFCGLWIYC